MGWCMQNPASQARLPACLKGHQHRTHLHELNDSDACRAHAAAEQQAAQVQEALSALQHSLHTDQIKRDKIMAALTAQSQQDCWQPPQQGEDESIQPQISGRPQGKFVL